MDLWQDTTMGTEMETSLSENFTVVEVEHWRVVLGIVDTVLMTSLTLFLMTGMGAAISVIEVRATVSQPP